MTVEEQVMKKVIQEIIDALVDEGVVVEDVASTPCYTLLDCTYTSVCFTILFKLNPMNVVGKVEVYARDDRNTTVTIRAEHLEEGDNGTAFAERVYGAIPLFF